MNFRTIITSIVLSLSLTSQAQATFSADSKVMLNAYDALLEEDPRDPEILFRRAGEYFKLNDYVRALDDVNNAIAFLPADDNDTRHQAIALRANILMMQHKYAQALDDITLLLNANPDSYALLYERGTAFYELGRYKEARADFNRMLRLNPRSQDATIALARVAVKENNLGTAGELADRAVSMSPQSGFIYLRRASVRSLMGSHQGAVDDYITAISLDDGSTPRALGELVALSRTNYPVVIAGLTSAISMAPKNGMFYFIRAMIAQGHCNYLAAIADYDKIINENLDSYPGLNAALAECYYNLGRYDIALINADYAISATPDNAQYYVLKSQIKRALDDNNAALAAAENALEKDSEITNGLVAKAVAQLPLGKSAEASVALSEATMVAPEDPRTAILRGWVLRDYRHQEANAVRAYERVLEMDFDFDNVNSLRGFALLSIGKKEEALNWMDKVLETANDYDGAVNYHAACLYSQAGLLDRAFRCMETSLEKGYANYHNWTRADEANLNCSPLRADARFKPLLDRYNHLFK